jgi:hypothetical protein
MKKLIVILFILATAFSANAQWVGSPISGGSGSSLPTGCSNGQVVVYNTSTGLWDTCAANAAAGTGDVIKSGTPANHYWVGWTDDSHIKGFNITASKPVCTNASGDPAVCAGTEGVWLTPAGDGSSLTGLTASQLPNAAADGTIKGVATFNANDFNASSGVVTIDYTNGQAAATGTKGFLTGTDWDTFNGKANANQTMYIGTTSTAINRGSGAQTIAGLTLTTPDIGVATATSINKMAITAPATSSTLAVANGKTFTVNNTLTLAGTDSSVVTFPAASGTVAYAGTMTNGKICVSNADGKTVDCNTDTPTGLGTITSVGNIASGPAFTAAVPGTTLQWSNATSGNIILTAQTGALGTNTAVSLPAASGTLVVGPANVPISIAGPTAARTVTLPDSNLTIASAGAASITIPTSGTMATLAGSESLTNKKLGSLTSNGFVTTGSSDGTLSVTVPGTGVSTWIATPSGANLASALTTALPSTKGGTGVANTANNIITFSGDYGLTLTLTGTTGVTLPTSGTLLNSTATGVQTFLTTPSLTNFGSMVTGEGTGVITAMGNATNGTGGFITYGNAAGTAAVLTGYSSGAGTVADTDTILQAINKLNGNDAAKLPLAGGTMTAGSTLITSATASGQAGIRLPHGTAPSSPTNGDVWTTTGGLYARINGSTVGPFGTSTATIGGSLAASADYITTSNGTANTIQATASTLTGSLLTVPAISAGAGGFTVDADGDVVGKSFTASKVSGTAGALRAYEANSTDTDTAGFRGPASLTANTSYEGQFPNARPTGAGTRNALVWDATATGGDGTPTNPYYHPMAFINLDTTYLAFAGGTLTGKLITATNGTAAGLNLTQSSADPSSPVNGDIWILASGLYARVAGSTVGPFSTGAPAFSAVTAGTNTNALVIGNSGSLGVTGTGTITATGLGLASQAAGDLFYGASATTLSRLAKGTAYQTLQMNSGATAPEWTSTLGATGTRLTKGWFTDLEITNTPTVNGVAANASSGLVLNPMTTAGDLILGGASGAAGRLAKGSDNYVLTIDSGTHLPVWAAATGGGNLSNSGSPAQYQLGVFADSTHVAGIAPSATSGAVLVSAGSSANPTFSTATVTTATNQVTLTNGTGVIQSPTAGTATLTTGTMAITGGKLSQFAATTSAELAGVLSDENASGSFMTNPMTTAGDLIVGGASGVSTSRLAAVATGQVLVSAGTSTAPAWSSAPTVTSLTATGVIDGLTNVVLTTSTTNAVESPEKLSIYTYNNYATAGTAVGYTLPTAAAGKQRCYGNYTGKTGVITVTVSANGQYIDIDGTAYGAAGTTGKVTSGGAAGDKACFVGVDSTHWILYQNKGTWTGSNS